ncbi:transposase [Verrucomicrobiales bacterium BCK34]|nr:transposase [Verrucomicrobiales bacterium BCK34]
MRQPRIRGEGKSYYHCLSRVVDGRFILGDEEREHFVALMRRLEAFHGMRVVTYCVMSNHFHLLIEEPDEETRAGWSEASIIERVARLHDSTVARTLREELERARAAKNQEWETQILDRYRKRMGDLACFMKELKQRFSQWYNRRNGRRGTLWEDRYKSVLVEGRGKALMTMAAYIDLNPVRAGMVSKVEDYRWCGYSSAVGGNRWARRGLGRILAESDTVSGGQFEERWEETATLYRLWLYHEGEVRAIVESGAKPGRQGFSREEVEVEQKRGGKLTLKDALRCRVRYFTDGAVLGSAQFVDEVFERNRSKFGKTRETGAREMRNADWEGLTVIRDLRDELIS